LQAVPVNGSFFFMVFVTLVCSKRVGSKGAQWRIKILWFHCAVGLSSVVVVVPLADAVPTTTMMMNVLVLVLLMMMMMMMMMIDAILF
jgi:hypothetical protein